METRGIRCPQCQASTEVGVPPPEGRPLRVVTLCPHCGFDLVVSRPRDGALRIRACRRWPVTCPYCRAATVARVPPTGVLRRKEITPCDHCRRPLVVERREEDKLVLRAHRGLLEGAVL